MPLPGSRIVHPKMVDEIRSVAATGMPDTCTISHRGEGAGSYDDDGNFTPATAGEVYSGPCRVQSDPRLRLLETGDETVTVRPYEASILATAAEVLVDDILVVTASADANLIGRPLIVRDVAYDTFLVRRLLRLEDHPEIASP